MKENRWEGQNPLGTEPIGKLILKYSVPTALTLMVNYFYNIVDQIFIGQCVGVIGMAATNVSMPFITISSAVALLIGDGCAANISLNLGQKQQRKADDTISHSITILLIAGIFLSILYSIFVPWIIVFFGATRHAYASALSYARIIIWGLPFLMLSIAFTAIIRADGNPKYTMKCMIAGAVINLILDPIFLFRLHMGVVGAGIATILGQIVAGLLCLNYLRLLQTVHIRKEALKPTRRLSVEIIKLGISSFITQIMGAAVQIVMNNLMTIYGGQSIYGSELSLSVYGMIMKVYQIAHSMFVGISSATQPINGYNYGAKNYSRVRQTYKTAIVIALFISASWFFVYQFFPRQIGMLFVSNDSTYLNCCHHFFKIYTMTFFIYGIHMATVSFFQGIGKPGKALSIPVFRQGICFIPFSILLSARFGLDGALAAVPIADLSASVLSLILAKREFAQTLKG